MRCYMPAGKSTDKQINYQQGKSLSVSPEITNRRWLFEKHFFGVSVIHRINMNTDNYLTYSNSNITEEKEGR